jgi:FkbM family methyltransferase
MLIPFSSVVQQLKANITGILHVGAHECEEMVHYSSENITNIYWIDAMEDKVNLMKSKGIKNIYQAVIDLEDGKEVDFHITNNGESSSILEFGSHSTHHPQVHVTKVQKLITTRLDTLIEQNNIPINTLNFLNLDIQGVELRALKSMEKYLQHIDYIYTEVNIEQVYKGCDEIGAIDSYLLEHGFIRVGQRIYQQFGWGDAIYVRASKLPK